MPSGHRKEGERTRKATVPDPYLLDLPADSLVSPSFSLAMSQSHKYQGPSWTRQRTHARKVIANYLIAMVTPSKRQGM
ncbi:hypothetical protein MRX96_051755 [Rhipicephalus microplus]